MKQGIIVDDHRVITRGSYAVGTITIRLECSVPLELEFN